MAIDGWDADKFTKQFARDLLNARKKAGRVIGKKNVAEAKKALGKVSPKRKKRITYKVRKNGTLVHLDSGLDARTREYGATIKANPGGALRINFSKEYSKLDGDFIANINGNLILFDGEGDDATPIAILKKKIVRKQVNASKKLSKIASDSFNSYLDEIETQLAGIT